MINFAGRIFDAIAVPRFAIKLALSVTNLIFPSVLLLARSIENPQGIRPTTVIALVFTLPGYYVFQGDQQK